MSSMKRIVFVSAAIFCLLLISQNAHAFSVKASEDVDVIVGTVKLSPDLQKKIDPNIGTLKLSIPETKEVPPKTDQSLDSSSQTIRVEVKPSSSVSTTTSSTNVKGDTISIGSSSTVGTGSATIKDTTISENKTTQAYVPPPVAEEKKQLPPIVVEEKREIIRDIKSFTESKKEETQSIAAQHDTKEIIQNQSIEQQKPAKEIDNPKKIEVINETSMEEKFQFDDSGEENMQEKASRIVVQSQKKNIFTPSTNKKQQPQSKQIMKAKSLPKTIPPPKIKTPTPGKKKTVKKNTKITIPNKNVKKK